MGTKPRVLLVSHSPLLSGGAELSLLEVIVYLYSKRYELKVVLPTKGEFSKKLDSLDIPYCIAQYRWSVTYADDKGMVHPDIGIFNADSVIEAYGIIESFKPDVVLTNTIVIPWYGYASKALGIPHITLVSEMYSKDNNFQLLPNDHIYLNQIKNSSDFIIYNSKFTQNTYKHVFSDIESTVVYPVITIPKKHKALLSQHSVVPKSSPIKLIVYGSISPHKNQLEALKAVSILQQSDTQVRLTILGPTGTASYKKELDSYIKDNGLKNIVTFLPYNPDPFAIIAKHAIVIVPSLTEAFGRVTVEAQALGRIVIGSNMGGTTELIQDDKTGKLYTLGNPANLAQKITDVIYNPVAAEKIAINAQQYAVSSFINHNSNQDICKVINKVARQKNSLGDRSFNLVDILIKRNIYANSKLSEYGAALDECIEEKEELQQKLNQTLAKKVENTLRSTKRRLMK